MITRSQYVRRLSQMLKTKEPCMTCPGFTKFWNYMRDDGPSNKFLESWTTTDSRFDSYICFEFCRDFVGLDTDRTQFGPRCPCHALGKDEALKRAHLALDEYQAGTHPWKKESK